MCQLTKSTLKPNLLLECTRTQAHSLLARLSTQLGMLTRLDRDNSRNFFSCSRINVSEVRVSRMSPKLGLHAANDTKCVIARPWRLDDGLWASPGKTAVTAFEVSSRVVGGLSPAPFDVAITGICLHYRHLNCSSTVELFIHPSTVSCSHTAAALT